MQFYNLSMLAYALQFLGLTAAVAHGPNCKATPGTTGWPNEHEWASLNRTISGRLIKTIPPGAVCHPTQPTFNPLTCPAVQAGWLTSKWHTDDPVSVIGNNWNNDTCLPDPTFPCSGEGYPIYVVNATCPEDVKKGVDFARRNNVRLIVKGTGHDYLGRSSGSNSLSIWTHHMKGLTFHKDFKPKNCAKSIDGHAITAAAGSQMLDLDEQAYARNLTIVSGGAETVGVGGYLTGGGHGALSSTYGLGADQVLELEIVTPGGDILTINECQNLDLFWAFRGGGGSTFGVITSVTIRAFPSAKFVQASVFMAAANSTDEVYWDAVTHVISRIPELSDQGISGYTFVVNNFTGSFNYSNITISRDGFYGILLLPLLNPSNTSHSMELAINKVLEDAKAPYPGQFSSTVITATYDSFWDWYKPNNGPLNAGFNQVTGSRLLDEKALTDRAGVKKAFKILSADGTPAGLYLVSGKKVWNADVRGGSNAVNPAWRKSYVHSVTGMGWTPLASQEVISAAEDKLTNVYVKALRDLAPDMGAYVNEADVNEPDFQHSFWGENYLRLLSIKRNYDPTDVLWCTPCVGNGRWKVIDNILCQV